MISRLTGKLLESADGSSLLIDVAGVGYEVEVAASVLATLPQSGGEISVHTHFVVREDAQKLYGFVSKSERDLFRAYIKINGVGPKLGLAIVSSLDLDSLRLVVSTNDPSLLTKVPGIGKTTADRILVELKNRFESLVGTAVSVVETTVGSAAAHEAEGALVALGYRPQEASQAIKAALAGTGPLNQETASDLIRRALRTFDKAVSS